MKNINRIFSVLSLAVFALAGIASAQVNTLIQTSLSSAITATQQTFAVASVTNLTATFTSSTVMLVDKELMLINTIGTPTTTSLSVQRGYAGTLAVSHINTSVVLAGRPDWFFRSDPTGSCTTATTYTTPYVNTANGLQWLCSTITLSWVPGFGNTSAPAGVTTAVASAAGQVTPTGPLFHITGALAITGFLNPIGIGAGQPAAYFDVIPDGTFTWTTANNIAIAGTAVVNRVIRFTWDFTNLKWVPSYV